MAKDHFEERGEYELLTGYYSPVSDAYMKEGLTPGKHRVNMCQLAVDSTSDWLMVDSWESRQHSYQRTAVVLDHFDYQLNQIRRGIKTQTGNEMFQSLPPTHQLNLFYSLSLSRRIQEDPYHVTRGW
jgi:nicotinic acid mononucleotide adenylyltransferase